MLWMTFIDFVLSSCKSSNRRQDRRVRKWNNHFSSSASVGRSCRPIRIESDFISRNSVTIETKRRERQLSSLMDRIERLQFPEGRDVRQFGLGMLTVERLAKGTTKMYITQRIDQRIEGWIEIAEPNRCGIERMWNASLTPGNNEKENEIGQPGESEHADEHSQLSGSFQFFLQRTGQTRIDNVIEERPNSHRRRFNADTRRRNTQVIRRRRRRIDDFSSGMRRRSIGKNTEKKRVGKTLMRKRRYLTWEDWWRSAEDNHRKQRKKWTSCEEVVLILMKCVDSSMSVVRWIWIQLRRWEHCSGRVFPLAFGVGKRIPRSDVSRSSLWSLITTGKERWSVSTARKRNDRRRSNAISSCSSSWLCNDTD